MNLENSFDSISDTGDKVIVLKAVGDCDCYTKGSLVNSEPNPRCKKCLGTGKIRTIYLTENIRSENKKRGSSSKEDRDGYTLVEEDELFFFKNYYDFLNNDDLICVVDFNLKSPQKLYNITSKQKFKYNNFYFLEVVGKKIQFSYNMSEFLKEVLQWIN